MVLRHSKTPEENARKENIAEISRRLERKMKSAGENRLDVDILQRSGKRSSREQSESTTD